MTHVFVTHAREDLDWASWVADGLLARGLDVELGHWHWRAGDNAIERMNAAFERASIVVGIWSPSYFNPARYSRDELSVSVVLEKARGTAYVPVAVAECGASVPPLGLPMVRIDLFGRSERECDEALDHRFGAIKTPWRRRPHPGVPFPGANAGRSTAGTPPSALTTSLALSRDMLAAPGAHRGFAIDEVDRMTDYWSAAFNWEAPEPVMGEAAQTLRDVRDAIELSRHPRDLKRLYNLGSRLHGVLAYAALDLGFASSADEFADAARFCAQNDGDAELEAWAWGTRALVARFDDRHDDALAFMRRALALDVAGQSRARLHSGASLSHAALGNETATRRHLELAELEMANSDHGAALPQGIFRFSHAKLNAYAANALAELGTPALAHDAVSHVKAALGHFRGRDPNERSFSDELLAQIHLAMVLHSSGDVGAIVPSLEPLRDVAPEYRTAWHRSYFATLAGALADDPEVPAAIVEAVDRQERDFSGEGPASCPATTSS